MFYAWLSTVENFPVEPIPGEPQACPVHGGDSGEAFRFWPDMPLTGGGICNSCKHLRAVTGLDLLAGWLMHSRGLKAAAATEEALARLREWLGQQPDLELPLDETAAQVSRWLGAYQRGVALSYLQTRGLTHLTLDTLPAAIRSTESWTAAGQTSAAMLALIQFKEGNPATFQYTYLDKGQGGYVKSTHITPAKRTASIQKKQSLSGAYVDLGATHGTTLLLGEGVETTLAGLELFRRVHPGETPIARATLSVSSFEAQTVPEGVTRVVLLADTDAIGTLREVAGRMALAHSLPVRLVAAELDDSPKADWLDVLKVCGYNAAVDMFRHAENDAESTAASVTFTPVSGVKGPGTSGPLTSYVIDLTYTQDSAIFATFNHLVEAATPKGWYINSDGQLLREQSQALVEVTPDNIAAWLATRVTWQNAAGDNPKAARTPVNTVKLWLADEATMPVLRRVFPLVKGVLVRPGLRAENQTPEEVFPCVLHMRNGYDPESGFYLAATSEDTGMSSQVSRFAQAAWQHVQDMPKKQAIHTLRMLAVALWRYVGVELFTDFRFNAPEDAIAARAMLFAPLIAPLVSATPLFVVDAPQPQAGKSTLAKSLAAIWGGAYELGGVMDNEEKFEKELGSAFADGRPLVLFDNVSHRLESPFLARLLTSPRETRVRKLGHNATMLPPQGLTMYLTANSAELQEELLRRSVYVRLSAPDPLFADRRTYRHRDLPQWCKTHAVGLRTILYQIVALWVTAGCPAWTMAGFLPDTAPFPSFESWADVTLSLLVWCGAGFPAKQNLIPLFLRDRVERLRAGDTETREVDDFLYLWRREKAENWAAPSDLVDMLEANPEVFPYVMAGQTRAAKVRRMGLRLHQWKGRRFVLNNSVLTVETDGVRTESHKEQWRLIRLASVDDTEALTVGSDAQIPGRA
jgi:hypothetical protein